MSFYRIMPDYDSDSRNGGRCSLTQYPKGDEPYVIRLGDGIEFEGYFDVNPSALEQLATEVLDMVPREVSQYLEEYGREMELALNDAVLKLAENDAAIDLLKKITGTEHELSKKLTRAENKVGKQEKELHKLREGIEELEKMLEEATGSTDLLDLADVISLDDAEEEGY